jgi:hypothetical protein
MTDTLHMHRLHVRYRVPEDDVFMRMRLDAVLARVLDEELEPALLRRGVPVGDEVCVRALRVPARLRLAAGEAGAAEEWSDAIANAIAAAVARGGADVVRYRSRHAALADLAVSVAAGRLDRAWAWRQLGLWRGGDAPEARGAATELVAALAAEPETIVAVLAHAASCGALPCLVALVDADEWAELAHAALAAAGVSRGVLAAAATARARAEATSVRHEQPSSASVVARVARTSALVRAVGGPLSGEKTLALAVLAWLETDPAAAAAAPFEQAVDIVRALSEQLSIPATPASELPAADPAEAVAETVPAGPEAPPDPDAPEPGGLPEPAAPALTRFGGLLFLLGVLDELGVPGEIVRSAPLARRPLRWTLHRLALTLAPADADDPAALAFAGLPPDADPPDDDGEPKSDDERVALGVLAGRVAERARERLDRPELSPDELLDFVCRRRGEILFDPGWLELRLPFDEVSVELRRAGLDLDPGWLPWLGCVVRFVYG